jgi:hypothetical protein
MLLLAHECGLQTAESRVVPIGEHDAVLVKRFNREHTKAGYRRGRMLSAFVYPGFRLEDVAVKGP